jgi:hypothetical protein
MCCDAYGVDKLHYLKYNRGLKLSVKSMDPFPSSISLSIYAPISVISRPEGQIRIISALYWKTHDHAWLFIPSLKVPLSNLSEDVCSTNVSNASIQDIHPII